MIWYNVECWNNDYYYSPLDCKLSYSHLIEDSELKSYGNARLVDTYQMGIL